MKIGFIGAGNMGSALARAASRASGAEVYISDVNEDKARELARALGGVATDSIEIAKSCDCIFLAVKPQHIEGVARSIAQYVDKATVVSMAAGVSLASIEGYIEKELPIIRIMPNTPVSVGRGMILAAPNKNVSEQALAAFISIMRNAGDIDVIDERLIDAGTAVSGCSPAFVYMFIEALADGGVTAGLPRDKAQLYAAKTLIGAASLLLESGKHPGELKDAVCSPGGSTIEGVRALEEGALRGVVSGAVIASFEKTKRLGK